MEKKTKPELPDAFLWLKDLPPESTAERFTAAQMIVCEVCGRNNAPTRLNCLYCGAAMKVDAENGTLARPVLRKLEAWEKGWNVVYLPAANEDFDDSKIAQTGSFLRLESGELKKILAARHILPVAQAENETEALVVEKHLQANGFDAAIVSDLDLEIGANPRRVHALEFGGSYLNLNLLGKSEEPIQIFYAAIELIIVGAIFERQVENRERRKGKDSFEIKDSRELSSDESLLDFYVKSDQLGYRVSAKNFDFSCLGADKKLLAGENFKFLSEKLKTQGHNAVFDDSYKMLRAALNPIWQLEQRTESLGWQHEGVGKISVENRLTVSNAGQFLRYSRMLRELSRNR